MAEPDSHPLSSRALDRLRKLANGNGLAPAAIQMISTQEHTYTLKGVMQLEPVSETKSQQYTGAPRGKDRKVLPNIGELQAEISRRKQAFTHSEGWTAAAIKQLKEQPAEGWGLDDVRIPLPELTSVFAASAPCPTCGGGKLLSCPQCHGQGHVVCAQCQGQKQEICYNCSGRGFNPAQPDQVCVICHGKRYVPCRFCRAAGYLPCPTCNGRRGVACNACNATGLITTEITLTCGANTRFHASGEDMPSGMRRAIDRITLPKLANGHADIEVVNAAKLKTETPTPASDPAIDAANAEMAATLAQIRQTAAAEAALQQTAALEQAEKPSREINYRAVMPYADLRLSFGGKRAEIAVFGKKAMLLGVPAFLDEALAPKRKALKRAAQGLHGIEEALEARVMRDALTLQLNGKGRPEELRKLYPLGLSPQAANEILTDMRVALQNFTRHIRAAVATVCVLVCAGLMAAVFLTSAYASLSEKLPRWEGLAIGILIPAALCFISWLGLASSTQMSLQRRFPNQKIPLRQETGKTGLTMVAAIVAAFGVILYLAPVTPWWVLAVGQLVKR